MQAIRFESPEQLRRRSLLNSAFTPHKEGSQSMELGIIGLGKMGFNMAERLRLVGA